MAANTTPIFPATPWAYTANLAAVSACTSRHPTLVASITSTPYFGVLLSPVSTNGRRIDKIQIQASSTSISSPTVAQTVLIWMGDGTNVFLIDELTVTPITPSISATAFNYGKTYANLVLPATFTLWTSTTVATTDTTTAIVITAFGGDY